MVVARFGWHLEAGGAPGQEGVERGDVRLAEELLEWGPAGLGLAVVPHQGLVVLPTRVELAELGPHAVAGDLRRVDTGRGLIGDPGDLGEAREPTGSWEALGPARGGCR